MGTGFGESQVAEFATELSVAATAFDGVVFLSLGPLIEPPVQIIFDNQTDVVAKLSVDGVTTVKTFQPGQSLTLDLSTNKGPANNFGFIKGKVFSVTGVLGTGNFLISYTYRVL